MSNQATKSLEPSYLLFVTKNYGNVKFYLFVKNGLIL
jgi:hypothetical protein